MSLPGLLISFVVLLRDVCPWHTHRESRGIPRSKTCTAQAERHATSDSSLPMQIPEDLKSWKPRYLDQIEGVIVQTRRAWKADNYPIAVVLVIRRDHGVPRLTRQLLA